MANGWYPAFASFDRGYLTGRRETLNDARPITARPYKALRGATHGDMISEGRKSQIMVVLFDRGYLPGRRETLNKTTTGQQRPHVATTHKSLEREGGKSRHRQSQQRPRVLLNALVSSCEASNGHRCTGSAFEMLLRPCGTVPLPFILQNA